MFQTIFGILFENSDFRKLNIVQNKIKNMLMNKLKAVKVLSITSILAFSTMIAGAQVPEENSKEDEKQRRAPLKMNRSSENTDVSEKELEKFVKVSQEIRRVRMKSQPKLKKAIKDKGLTMKRYQTIKQKEQGGRQRQNQRMQSSNPDTSEVSEAEKEKFKEVQKEVKKIQRKSRSQMMQVIEENDLSRKRFQEIAQALRSDRELQKRMKKMQKQRKPQPKPQGEPKAK